MGIIFCEVPEMVIYLKQINTIWQPSPLPTQCRGLSFNGTWASGNLQGPHNFLTFKLLFSKLYLFQNDHILSWPQKSNLFKTKEMKKPWVSSLGRNLKGHGIRWRLAETGRIPTVHAGQTCQSWCGTAGQGTRLHSQVWLCCHSLMPLPGPRHFLCSALFKGLIVPSL